MMASPCKPPSSVPIKFPSGSYIGANPVRVFIQNRITKTKHIRTYRIILFRQRILTKPAEGIVIVAFQHFAIVVDYRTYAAKMVGHEITGFDTRSCRYKTTAREGAALHRQGCAMLAIYQRTRVLKTVARGVRRRELGTIRKIRIFCNNRIATHYFFDQVQVILAEVQTRMGIVKHIASGIVDIPYTAVDRVARDSISLPQTIQINIIY